jgi:oligopeptide transport system substrate-binding protein
MGSDMTVRRAGIGLAALLPLALASCGLFGELGPVRIAAIGPLTTSANPVNGELSAPNAALLEAASQGLVSYDADGQIDIGLAERWTVTTDGRSYIFRIREAKWTNGRKVMAGEVAAILRSYLAPRSRHMLRDDFPEVEAIRAMTDSVIEIRLSIPQPAMLELLAQPSMAVVNKGLGWGPMRPKRVGRAMLLTPAPDPLAEDPEEAEAAADDPAASVELVGTSAAGALARFKNGYADGVVGGRFSTLPVFIASNIGPDRRSRSRPVRPVLRPRRRLSGDRHQSRGAVEGNPAPTAGRRLRPGRMAATGSAAPDRLSPRWRPGATGPRLGRF